MTHPKLYKFRLYIAGDTENSAQAMRNLTAFCEQRLPEQHQIEIVDVLRDPQRGLADGVLMTPTLVKLSPLPLRKIIGTLSDVEPMLHTLGLEPIAA